jgi:hypothetical protein
VLDDGGIAALAKLGDQLRDEAVEVELLVALGKSRPPPRRGRAATS